MTHDETDWGSESFVFEPEDEAGAPSPAPVSDAPAPAEPAMDEALLPPYLRPVADSPARTYGTLSYNRRSRCWVVKGDPSVTELCKRLFPGSAGARRGEARFTAHRRMVGDLQWLMLRFPLQVRMQDLTRWDQAVTEARQYALRQIAAERQPPVMTPPEGTFSGELMPFQQEGLAFLMQHERCLLADEMGLGKTVQALAYLAASRCLPALIVPPPHLTLNWQEEARRFLRVEGHAPTVHVIRGLKPYPLPPADIYIMHYLLLRGWKDTVAALPVKAVIFDEIQELRHRGTEKYSAASLLAEAHETVIGLSGTPIYNTGGEIWNVVNILDYHFLGDWESFSREWCYGYGNSVVARPELLGDYLRREGLMLRRTKRDVLSQLPPKRRLVQELDFNDRVYAQLMAPLLPKLRRWREDAELTASQRALLEDEISQQARLATGVAKAPYVCQFVRALLEGGEKVLLFAHHHAVMDLYKKELKAFSPGFITGRESTLQKAAAAARFMGEKTDLLCVSLRAASGLNLQRATCVVFGELDWSPAVHAQAEDRAHRIGQEDSLLCYYLVSPGGSDAEMQEALGLKVSQFVALMGDTPITPQEAREAAGYARRHVVRLAEEMAAQLHETPPQGQM